MKVSQDEEGKFYKVRKEALSFWKDETGRRRYKLNDNFSMGFECAWQDTLQDSHISVFCSLGDFVTNISDMLTDSRFDKISFDTDEANALFRYYGRIFLITSEILTDFQDIIKSLVGISEEEKTSILAKEEEKKKNIKLQKKIRNFLDGYDHNIKIGKTFQFINTIYKHKTSSFHLINHHIRILFEDNNNQSSFSQKRTISLQNISEITNPKEEFEILMIPKLIDILKLIVNAYHRLDDFFKDNNELFLKFCSRYSTPYHNLKN